MSLEGIATLQKSLLLHTFLLRKNEGNSDNENHRGV